MPYDEEDDTGPSERFKKTGLKKVSEQKSMFEGKAKKPSQEEFDQKVKQSQERQTGHKQKASELAIKFRKIIDDKTLPENKNVFVLDFERDLLREMIQLAMDINSDPNEIEGMGSLSCITMLFKTCFSQRDRLNKLEYNFSELSKNLNEIVKTLDNGKVSG